jgi:ribosomal protein S27E
MVADVKTAVRTTACASCGALVPIHIRASVQVVCPFCKSTLVRTDLQWESIGTMAALANDLTPLYIGLSGQYQKTRFTIIGRLQQQYEEGIWNEWLLQLDNRKIAWLGEGSGLYYFTVPSTTAEALPAFNSLSLGQQVTLEGKGYSVTNIEQARCIATQGEIPFIAEAGRSVNLVDLAGEHGIFASLDYSDDLPKLYTGITLNLDELTLDSIGTKELEKKASKELRCAGCGNAMTIHNPGSLVVACVSCKVVNNVSNGGKLIFAYNQAKAKLRPSIPLGTTGTLEGSSYEVIGFVQKNADGDIWDEYLLYNPSKGIHWLVCSQGHWTFMRPAKSHTYSPSVIFHRNLTFKHFSDYDVTTTGVLGEFYWQVKKGERNRCTDYICPPFILCSEKNQKEVTWTEGYYLDGAEVAQTFGIEEVPRWGSGINQSSPSILGYVVVYLVTMMLAVIMGSVLHNVNSQVINIGHLDLVKQERTAKLTSEPFTINAAHGLFQVQNNTNVSNDWANFEYSLTNQTTGETRIMNHDIAYYSGYDSDGGWSEGSSYDTAVLNNVIAGTYVLEVEAETDSLGSTSNISADIRAIHADGNSKNIWLLFVILGIFPLFAGINKYYFEKKRWDESDHPWEHFQ